MSDIFIRVLLGFLAGWFIGFMMHRTACKSKYEDKKQEQEEPKGILKLVYDVDSPDQPAMGLEIESLGYLLTHDSVYLEVVKVGFPKNKGPIYLRSRDDKSA